MLLSKSYRPQSYVIIHIVHVIIHMLLSMLSSMLFQERKVVIALIEELQTNLAMDLDSSPIIDRNPGPILDARDNFYLVVGSSNARWLSEALKRKLIPTGYVFSNNWRATKKSVSDMAAHITEELATRPYTAVIFHLLDNNIYFELGEVGSKSVPKKGPDGKFHVSGDLAIADKDGQYAILKLQYVNHYGRLPGEKA